MKKPTQRHPYCKQDMCSTCFEDCMSLAHYLEVETGTDDMDHLEAYRKWFDSRGIRSESEYGWPLPIVFDESHINQYLEKYK